jgi:hypothetical protein
MCFVRKKLLISVLVLLSASLFANEVTAVWTRLYSTAATTEQKLAIMTNIVEQHSRDMIPVLQDALTEELVNLENISDSTERNRVYSLMRMVVDELGDLKATASAVSLYVVSEEVDDPFLQAAAIRAVGRIGAAGHAQKIAFHLRNINLGITDFTVKEEVETIVSACVETLELLRRPVGFSPVFFTAIGRYSAPVIKRAERAMINMIDDPTDLLLEILTYENDFAVKHQVLLAGDRSKAPEERKVFLAKEALDQGLKYEASNRVQQVSLSNLRTRAANMLKQYAGADDEAFILLDQMVRKSFSMTESLTALEALGASGSDAAARLLAAYLGELNARRKEGYTFSSENVVRATINALGNIGSPIGRPALIEVEFSNWSGDTRRLARSALDKLR